MASKGVYLPAQYHIHVIGSGLPYVEDYGAMWVERWILDACDQYSRSDGYGGLTLVEYLRKLA